MHHYKGKFFLENCIHISRNALALLKKQGPHITAGALKQKGKLPHRLDDHFDRISKLRSNPSLIKQLHNF